MEEEHLTTSLMSERASRTTPFQKHLRARVVLQVGVVVVCLGLLVWIQFTLLTSSATCQFPLREWLNLYSAYLVIVLVVTVVLEAMLLCCKRQTVLTWKTWLYVNELFFLVLFVWTCFGSYWYFATPSCEEEFPEAYQLMLVLLVIYYSVYGLICCIVSILCFLGLVFSGFLSLET